MEKFCRFATRRLPLMRVPRSMLTPPSSLLRTRKAVPGITCRTYRVDEMNQDKLGDPQRSNKESGANMLLYKVFRVVNESLVEIVGLSQTVRSLPLFSRLRLLYALFFLSKTHE